MKKELKIEITEMFMAKASRERCFFGIIKRWRDDNGQSLVFSKICMPNDGFLCAQEQEQKTLGKILDKICIMVLDGNLHSDGGKFTEICGEKLFMN
jgi:hypothetical protein